MVYDNVSRFYSLICYRLLRRSCSSTTLKTLFAFTTLNSSLKEQYRISYSNFVESRQPLTDVARLDCAGRHGSFASLTPVVCRSFMSTADNIAEYCVRPRLHDILTSCLFPGGIRCGRGRRRRTLVWVAGGLDLFNPSERRFSLIYSP